MITQAARSKFISLVREADVTDGIHFTSLFDEGVGLLQLDYSYPAIAGLLGVSTSTMQLWRANVALPSEAIIRREILEKLVLSLLM